MKTTALQNRTPHHSLFWHVLDRLFFHRFHSHEGATFQPRKKKIELFDLQEVLGGIEELETYLREEVP